MSGRLHLHIGPRKTGTTFLQRNLVRNQRSLAAVGVSYPVSQVTGERGLNHESALIDASRGLVTHETHMLARLLRRHSSDVVLSGEALAACTPEEISRIVEYLSIDDLHVIVTARARDRVLPSAWQQHVRNGRCSPYPTFLRNAMDDTTEVGMQSMPYTYAALIDRWSSHAAAVSLVTVPREHTLSADPDVLWRRFLTALEVDPASLSTPLSASHTERHEGLTACESFVLREINAQLEAAGLSVDIRRYWAKQLIQQVFYPRSHRGSPLRLPLSAWQTARAEADRDVAELGQLVANQRVRLVGDMEDLRVSPQPAEAPTDAQLAREIADLAGSCIAYLHANRR